MRKETILKKALEEAMTEKYSEELINMKTPEHEFSSEFEVKMKNLVRKTDNPFFRYSKYLSLAACAVIAVGCAVLIPALNSKRITTAVPPDSMETAATEAVISTAATEAPVIDVEETVTPESDEVIEISKDPDFDYIPPLEEESQDNPGTQTGEATTSVTEITAPVTEETESADVATTTDEFEVIGNGDEMDNSQANPGTGSDADPNPNGSSGDEIEEISGDMVDESDDDVAEDDCEPIEEWEDEAVEEEDSDESVDSRPSYPEADTLGELYTKLYKQDFTLDWVKKNSYSIENANYSGVKYDTADFGRIYTDYDFVKEFLSAIGTARKTEITGGLNDCAEIWLNPVDSFNTALPYWDSSDVNCYGEIYFGEGSYEEDWEVEEDEEGPGSVKLEIYRTGIIRVSFASNKGSVLFTAPAEAVGSFFENVDNVFLNEEPETIGDIIADRNITEENICRSYGDVRYVYDYHISNIGLYNSKSIIMGFLNENKDKKLRYYADNDKSNNDILIHFGLKDNSSVVYLRLFDFNKAAIRISGGDYYAFDIEKEQFISLFKELVGLCGYKNPVIYNTMADYIKDKRFNKLGSIAYYTGAGAGYVVDNEEQQADVLEKMRQLILKEAEKAEYALGEFKYGEIVTWVPGWTRYKALTISTDGVVYVCHNRFKVSKEFIDELKKLIIENKRDYSGENEAASDMEEELIEETDEE